MPPTPPPPALGATIEPATPADLPTLRAVYAEGARMQQARGEAVWPPPADALLAAETAEGRLMKVAVDGRLAGVFTVAYADPVIWTDRDRGAHLYLHRISRAPGAGGGLMAPILAWARAQAETRGLEGVRLDTWAENEPLAAYYEGLGFRHVGEQAIPPDAPLPAHYHGIRVVLFELAL
ncbi:MAG TPA: GNAT family N-acetyltransferase [Rhodothermales bacterium]|nr:GNAT family N-acetyltransferase [Rhodothermales bacterium]